MTKLTAGLWFNIKEWNMIFFLEIRIYYFMNGDFVPARNKNTLNVISRENSLCF